jgi:ferredoxin--NADP+ reductase
MAYVICEPCIGTKDTACVDVCPVDCIHPTKEEAAFATAEMLYIDPETCIDCGLCVDECPVTAIFPEEDVPTPQQSYIQINREIFKSPTPPGRPTRSRHWRPSMPYSPSSSASTRS